MAFKKYLSYEAACKATGSNPLDLPYKKPKTARQKAYNSLHMLEEIFDAHNGKKWVADFSDSNIKKWGCYFEYDPAVSAFRLWTTAYGLTCAGADAGVRLSAKSQEIAQFIGSHPPFLELWNNWLLRK